jgi:DNA-binding transcriptional LysR family regulator
VGFSGRPLCTIEMIPVAAPHHSLFTRGTPLSSMDLKSQRHIVLRDSGQRRQQDVGWLVAEQRWTASHFYSSISLIKAGLGFAFVPRNWITRELESGELRQLELTDLHARRHALYLMLSAPDTAGPATRALADLLTKDLQ